MGRLFFVHNYFIFNCYNECMKRVAVFIDNSNVYKGLAGHIRDFPGQWSVKQYDPLILSQKLAGDRQLVAVYFYCAPPPASLYDSNPQALTLSIATMQGLLG